MSVLSNGGIILFEKVTCYCQVKGALSQGILQVSVNVRRALSSTWSPGGEGGFQRLGTIDPESNSALSLKPQNKEVAIMM